MTPEARFAQLVELCDLGVSVERTAKLMHVREQYVYGAAHVLGLQFRRPRSCEPDLAALQQDNAVSSRLVEAMDRAGGTQ